MAGRIYVCSLLTRKFRKKKVLVALLVGCMVFILGQFGRFRRSSSYARKFKHPNGYVNAIKTQEMCEELKEQGRLELHEEAVTIRWNRNKTVMYCPVYKVGTTFWRRVFMIDGIKTYENKSTPYDIAFDKELKSDKYDLGADSTGAHFKFMFSRNPYDRLLSVYIDKLLAPNPYFWKLIGIPAKQISRQGLPANTHECGHDVTFQEFIQYVIFMLESKAYVDPHVLPIHNNCQPCIIHYDFIGTMENFRQDSYEILQKLNMKSMAAILNATGSELAAIDAIKDTLSQPFAFRTKYLQCISLEQAVFRAWRKLMIRGLIGSSGYDVNSIHDFEIDKYSYNKLVTHALSIRKSSSSRMRRKSVCDWKMAFWAEVDDKLIVKLQELYAKDFRLFQYSNQPDHLLLYC